MRAGGGGAVITEWHSAWGRFLTGSGIAAGRPWHVGSHNDPFANQAPLPCLNPLFAPGDRRARLQSAGIAVPLSRRCPGEIAPARQSRPPRVVRDSPSLCNGWQGWALREGAPPLH